MALHKDEYLPMIYIKGSMEDKMDNREIKGFTYSIKKLSSFEIIGFTKIVNSGGEMYDEIIQKKEKWEILKKMNSKNKSVYGIASMDKGCPEGKYRYTMGIEKDESYIEDKIYAAQLFSMNIKESNWVIFSLDFENEFGKLWGNDPYKLIDEIRYSFNNAVGLHIDVFAENYDGHKMEFWMPVK
jgi:hypothetical protein